MKQRRNTRQRQLVLEAVLARCDHPTAEEVYADVRKADAKISRGTVYRNLSILAQRGDIMQVKVPGADRFDCRLDLHYHFFCVRCGAVSDVPLSYRQEWDRQAAESTGSQIIRHRTVFEGVCCQCRLP